MVKQKHFGRPKLESGRRDKIVNVRFTEEEFKVVLDLEKTLGISKTEIVRQKVLKDALKVVVHAKELIRQLDRIGAELGRSGNNINQLARHANVLNRRGDLDPNVVTDFTRQMAVYLGHQADLEVILRKIIRALLRS